MNAICFFLIKTAEVINQIQQSEEKKRRMVVMVMMMIVA